MKKRFWGALAVCLCAAALAIALPQTASAEEGNATTAKSNHTLHSDIVTIVDNSTQLFTPIASHTDEDYYFYSRRWNGICSVITAGNNIFVAWQTGGVREPDPTNLNYIAIAASKDGGATWIDPFIVIDPVDEAVEARVPQFYRNPEGKIYLLFSYSTIGIHCIEFHNLDGDLLGVTYEDPFYIGVNNSSFTKPTILSDGSILYLSGKAETYVIRSTDNGKSFQRIASIESESPVAARVFAESVVIEKKDGTLWGLRRLENAVNGGIEQSFSADKGLTWTTFQANLPAPLTSPGSRFTMCRLQSGNLLFVTNAAGMGGTNRTRMTAYLSTDDGETWPHALLLDPLMSSYPDIWEDNGKIYIAFDKDRYGEGGIRLCIVTEADLTAGAFVSKDAAQLVTVTKMNDDYADIKSVNGAFPAEATFRVGTELNDILAGFPTEITVTDEYGNSHTISGKYRVTGFHKDKVGTYKAYFIADLPNTLKDSFGKLEFKITLAEKKGCGSIVSPTANGGAACGICLAAGVCATVAARKKKNGKKLQGGK